MSFLTPGFLLAGLALAAVPIIIHLLNRGRYQTVQWAAMRYLLEAMRKNRRRLRFESLLLLLARCAACLLIALALARPIGCADSSLASLAGSRLGLHVFVLDDSYSMGYQASRPDAATHFEQARRVIRQSIERLESGSQQVAVIAASTPARVIVQPTHDLDAAARAVDGVTQSFAGTDLAGALRLANGLADRAKDLPSRTLVLATDCTNSALSTDAQLPTLARESATRFKIAVHQLGLSNQSNRSVADVATADAFVRLGFGTDLVATVRGYGNAGEARVDWKLGDRPLPGGSTTIRPEPTSPPITNSQAAFDAAGPVDVEVRLAGDGDRLPIDDVRRHVVDVVGDVKVLIVEGRRGLSALQGSGFFLRLALAPPADPSGGNVGRYVTPVSISDLELAGKPLDEFRAVMLAGVGSVTPDAAASLKRYVERGGSVVIFMGEPVNGDEYNRTLGAAGLLPGKMEARVDSPGGAAGFTFDFDPAARGPMLGAFRDVVKSGLDTAQTWTYWRVRLDPARAAQTILKFRANSAGDADPAITVQSVGSGRVVFVATAADAEWSTLVAKPAYVTLVHELLGGAVGSGGAAWMNRTVGDRVELPPTFNLTAAPRLRESPTRVTPMSQSDRGDGTLAWRSDPLVRPGLYTVEAGDRSWPVAVALPAEEADVRTLDAAAVRHALGDVELDLRGDSLPDAAVAQAAANDFAWPVLAVLLPLLALESLMAWKFSRGKAAT